MGEKLVVGPIDNGLVNARTAFVINNDAFPRIINAYQWRGRIKRKRGTSKLGRLTRYFDSEVVSYSASASFNLVASAGNLLTGFSLQTNGNIIPGTVTIVANGITTYTDPTMNGILSGGAGGTINYATGAIVLSAQGVSPVTAIFKYYPDLPVMGIEDLILSNKTNPGTLSYDTKYSYNVATVFPYTISDVSFYKNPPLDSDNLPGYTPKEFWTPTTWNGKDYQQFWTTNYQGAHWATNGVSVPFSITNIGMQFKPITGITIVTPGNGTTMPAVADLTITAHGLVRGDFVFINEVVNDPIAMTGLFGINFQTGYVTSADPQAANTVRVTFPFAILTGTYTSGGIAQYLTNRSNTTQDCLRWYDGAPVDANGNFTQGLGWVNFAPPLSQDNFSIADIPANKYYLIGAKMIIPFKDRLLFLGPVVQTSETGSQVYLQDTVIYSQNGTPYYTASFNGDVDLITTDFHPILLPADQTSTASAYFEDQTGFGGFITAGVPEKIQSASSNEDVLIVEFDSLKTRLVYSGNDIIPFSFFLISTEYGTSSTFSSINMDDGVISRGNRGYTMTSQTKCSRIDLLIPDEVFETKLLDNGAERFCAQRDFINEWIYFTYPSDQSKHKFPTQTLFYNYRDESWSIFNECYTTYGPFKKASGFTWATVGAVYPTWADWNVPWNAGSSNALQPLVVGGNQQGFLMVRDDSTDEDTSLYIQDISSSSIVTSPDHCLSNGDYIIISGCIGTISYNVNNQIFQVSRIRQNDFRLSPPIPSGFTYFGGGLITRYSVPFVQTKQFPQSWGMARKTRIGVQQYLLQATNNSQITLLIYLSQNSSTPYNTGVIVPEVGPVNSSLIYSTVLHTCPESTNIGLTPANVNLQTPTATQQRQIWHRINTSLIGDTVQLGFTLSDAQMRSFDNASIDLVITGATQANPCVIACSNDYSTGDLVRISNVLGMIGLNNNIYYVISATSTTITINVNTLDFDEYISGGTIRKVAPVNQTAEIVLHGFILDLTPSQLLA